LDYSAKLSRRDFLGKEQVIGKKIALPKPVNGLLNGRLLLFRIHFRKTAKTKF
jgi:hypothetical protein